MMESWLRDSTREVRARRFLSMRRPVISLLALGALLFFSCTAEFWANSKPLVAKYQGTLYFPAFSTYHPSEFKQEGFVTDYRALDFKAPGNWAIWPLVNWDPFESNQALATYPAPPTSENWLGTDDRGRDVFVRLLYGFRYSFGFAILTWLFAFSLGTLAGAIMGFSGGRIDFLGQRVVEVFEAFPDFLVTLIVIASLGASLWTLVVCQTLFGWMRISIFMRAEFLRLRKRDFVEAARAQGLGMSRILFRHILPNGLGPLVTFSPMEISNNIYILAVLDYLGMGLPAPTPSWGELLQQAISNFMIAWWLAFYPSLVMVLTLIALTFVGEGVRAAYDPHLASTRP